MSIDEYLPRFRVSIERLKAKTSILEFCLSPARKVGLYNVPAGSSARAALCHVAYESKTALAANEDDGTKTPITKTATTIPTNCLARAKEFPSSK